MKIRIKLAVAAISLFSGCANFAEKPEKIRFEQLNCQKPIYVDATAIKFPVLGDRKEVSSKLLGPIIIDSSTAPNISKDSDLDRYIILILRKSSDLTGCKFTLSQNTDAQGKITLVYNTNVSHNRMNFWDYLSVATLTIIPDVVHNEDKLSGTIEFDNKKREFSYDQGSSFYMGWFFLPLMPFGDSWSQSMDNFAIKFANDICEVSGRCKTER